MKNWSVSRRKGPLQATKAHMKRRLVKLLRCEPQNAVLSHRMHLLISLRNQLPHKIVSQRLYSMTSFRKATPLPNHQLTVDYDQFEKEVDGFVVDLTLLKHQKMQCVR